MRNFSPTLIPVKTHLVREAINCCLRVGVEGLIDSPDLQDVTLLAHGLSGANLLPSRVGLFANTNIDLPQLLPQQVQFLDYICCQHILVSLQVFGKDHY